MGVMSVIGNVGGMFHIPGFHGKPNLKLVRREDAQLAYQEQEDEVEVGGSGNTRNTLLGLGVGAVLGGAAVGIAEVVDPQNVWITLTPIWNHVGPVIEGVLAGGLVGSIIMGGPGKEMIAGIKGMWHDFRGN